MRKRYIIFVLLVVMILTLSIVARDIYKSGGDVSEVSHSYKHNSDKAVKMKFKDFEGCSLIEIYFDSAENERITSLYLNNGKGSSNGATKENVIVLLSSFKVNKSEGDGSLNTGATYEGWNWILIRENENSSWVVDDWGY